MDYIDTFEDAIEDTIGLNSIIPHYHEITPDK